MGKREVIKRIKEVHSSYHIPSMPNYYKRPKNAIYISAANGPIHEHKKLDICLEFRKLGIDYITEAVRNKKDKNGKSRRVDIVNLNTGDEIEIETDPKRAKRFEGEAGVIVIKTWEDK